MLISEITQVGKMDTSDWIAIVAAAMSLVSIIVSVMAMRQTTNINKTNLQAEYFQKVFFEYIIEKIPEKSKNLRYVGTRLDSNYRELVDIVMEMVQKSSFFAYAKQDFYINLKEKCKELEDIILEIASINTDIRDEQKQNIIKINLAIQGIVELINDNYYKF